MDQNISDLLFSIPLDVDYTTVSTDLDLEDIPNERINRIKELLKSSDIYIAFQAARILTSWGVDDGFEVLVKLFEKNELAGLIDHRLYDYDETYLHVLDAFISYWANKSDEGCREYAREKIFPYVSKIISMSNEQLFSIRAIFGIIEKYHYDEYIPLLKNHLQMIIKNQTDQYWKIHDLLKFLLKIDPIFVKVTLKNNDKRLADYGL